MERPIHDQVLSLTNPDIVRLRNLGEEVKKQSNSPESIKRATRNQIQNLCTLFSCGLIEKEEFNQYVDELEDRLIQLGEHTKQSLRYILTI